MPSDEIATRVIHHKFGVRANELQGGVCQLEFFLPSGELHVYAIGPEIWKEIRTIGGPVVAQGIPGNPLGNGGR